jgi:hypothetical protein
MYPSVRKGFSDTHCVWHMRSDMMSLDMLYDIFSWLFAPQSADSADLTNSTDSLDSAAGNEWYEILGDAAVVSNDGDPNVYVRANGQDWYTTAVTKEEWQARRANNSANIDNNERNYAERADSVSGLPESVATPSQTKTPIAQLDDIAAQRLKPPQIQNEFTEAAVNGRDLNNDLSDLIHTQPLQELSSSWQDFLVGAKNHIGAYPMQRDKQEVEFGVEYRPGPFGSYCKYRNGVLMPESKEKVLDVEDARRKWL